MHRKRWKSGLFTVILVLVLVAGIRLFDGTGFETIEGRPQIADGDSLSVAGERIRLLGVDAPELAQICRSQGAPKPCGKLARQALRRLIGSRAIRCETEGRDRFGRLLARCYLDEDDIGRMMVAAGWAVSRDDYTMTETAARLSGTGIWSMQFDDPADWRADHDRDGEPRSFWSRLWG